MTEIPDTKAFIGVTTGGVTRKKLQVSEAGPSKGSKKKMSRSAPVPLVAIDNELVLELVAPV